MTSAHTGNEARLTVEDWTTLQVRLHWAYAGEVAVQDRRARTRPQFLAAWGLRRGRVELHRGASRWRAGPGEWLLAGPEPMEHTFSDDAEIVSINFRLEWPSGEALLPAPLVLDGPEATRLGEAAEALVGFVRQAFPGVKLDLWRTEVGMETYFGLQQVLARWVKAYLGAVLAAGVVPERMSGLDARVLAALRELDRWPWSRPFREPELATRVGLSAGHLDRLFVQARGETPRAYWQKRRLESARATLANGDLAVKEVAFRLGFRSAAHFCRWFKAATGESPGRVRRTLA